MIPHLHPIPIEIRQLDSSYLTLHLKSSMGTSTPEEEALLNRLCAEKEAEWIDEHGDER